jgi:hypothetical protein
MDADTQLLSEWLDAILFRLRLARPLAEHPAQTGAGALAVAGGGEQTRQARLPNRVLLASPRGWVSVRLLVRP